MERDFLIVSGQPPPTLSITTSMKKESLEDKLPEHSDWLRMIPFYSTFSAIKYGWRNPLFSRKEAIGYSVMYDLDALQMYGLMSALVLKGLGVIGS